MAHASSPPAMKSAAFQQSPSKAPSAPSAFYRPELDCLRAVAFLMVFTSHIPALPGAGALLSLVEQSGAAGVCVFFTLSAYLITELLLRERAATGTIHRAAFYARRILRIWPLYFLAIAIAVAGAAVYHRWSAEPRFLLPYLALSGNIATSAYGVYPRNGMLAPLWSISLEEQFYVLWPLLLCWKGRRALLATSVVLLPLAWCTDLYLPLHGAGRDPGLWTNSLNQFQYFALGALLALLLHNRSWQPHRSTRLGLLFGAGLAFSLAAQPLHFLFGSGPPRPLPMLGSYLCLDLAAVSLLLAFLGWRPQRWAEPLRRLGRISYGMYVFHYTVWIGVAAAVTRLLHLDLAPLLPAVYLLVLLITVCISAASYRFVESPFLRLKNRLAFIPTRPA